ncbi:MAG: hypothetical protein VX078_22820, partial [Pseudomonadota bacterium]|nr:hypothetical protein [Pseudomonadota bacterium]
AAFSPSHRYCHGYTVFKRAFNLISHNVMFFNNFWNLHSKRKGAEKLSHSVILAKCGNSFTYNSLLVLALIFNVKGDYKR